MNGPSNALPPAAVLRPITPADLAAVHALHVRVERHDRIPISTPLEEFDEWLTDPHLDLETDTRLVEVGGQVVAWGRIWYRPSGEREERTFVVGAVDPGHRGQGIGRALLAWQLARSREILHASSQTLPRYIRAYCYDFEQGPLRLYARHGLRPVRYAAEMLRDLETLPAQTSVPDISIIPWERAREEEARLVMNDAFADHWASTRRGPEAWQHELDSHGSRPDLSFFALENGRMVGATRNSHYPSDHALNGRLDGWVGQIGVLRSHRKRGIASALIAASLAAFRQAGLTHSALGVDSEN
ncbi:MAG: GNAT family N-acetyltransferase, partial [Candidatus Eisenbacteria bacterium]